MKILSKIKHKLSVAVMTVFALVVGASSAFAADGDLVIDSSQVTSTFSSMAIAVLVIIGLVAASAVTIMGAILAWKYGKKLFRMLAN